MSSFALLLDMVGQISSESFESISNLSDNAENS